MYYTRQARVFRFGSREQRRIALTFDDGPDARWTPAVLDALRDRGVRATFFVLGKFAERYPATLRRIIAEGHVVGNHSYDHFNAAAQPLQVIAANISRAEAVIRNITGLSTALLRPPFGIVNDKVRQVASQQGYNIILWSVDPQDWRGLSAATIVSRVVPVVNNGDIILLHSGEGPNLQGTVAAIPIIVDQLRARGFQFVTVPELLNIPAYKNA